MMSASSNGGPEWPLSRGNDAVGEESAVPSTSHGDSATRLGFGNVASAEKEARVSIVGANNSVETRVSDDANECRILNVENEANRLGHACGGALENPPSSSVSRGHGNDKKNTDVRNGKSESKKVKSAMGDYDSILSEFDQFATKGAGEAVEFEYEIGDMVWGKVKSHPWWPGHIYDEAFASPSVQRSKREGHVLVAFFGDSSYGWFDPAELVPFEGNFADKSLQTSSRAFVRAVEEAIDEISRRQGLGLVCCCRNEFNFRPSTVEGYFVVDVGDYDPGVYSLRQISKAREDFQTKEMLLFVQQLALRPMIDQHWNIEFIKNKATVSACRKALFEEFDETYAQAFGTVPVRPQRPSAPMSVDPSKAPLSGPLVFAEALDKGKLSVKLAKSKEQVEKDRYLFIRRDAPINMKTKKRSSVQVGPSPLPLLIDGSGLSGIPVESEIKSHIHQTSISSINDGQHQSSSDGASMISGIKHSVGSRKLVEGGQKNAKIRKRHAELSAENATLDMKKRKIEASADSMMLVEKTKKKEVKNEVGSSSENGVAVEKVSGMLLDAANNNQLDTREDGNDVEAREAVELSFHVRDLHALALDPFHGVERNCPASTQLLFLKYRSLVYQKSLVQLPSTGNEATEAHSTILPGLHGLTNKPTMNLMRPSARPIDDPTKCGKKRGPSDRPETFKKKKLLSDPEGIIGKKIKIDGSEYIKKKKIIVDSKLQALGNKIPQRSQGGDVKENLPKSVKLESSSKRMMCQQALRVFNPTMVVMKFPAGATLPSGPQLRAKFARFGTLDLDATRVFWKTYTCRLVYLRKVDAEEAFEFAVGSDNLFGSTNVRCYIKEVGVGGSSVESEPVKRESAFEHNGRRAAAKTGIQQSAQLKSCLKKPANDEGVNGNGNGRGTRVKFVVGGERSSSSKVHEQLSSFQMALGASHNNEHCSMDASSSIKDLPKFSSHSSHVTHLPTTTTTITHHQFQNFPNNMSTTEILPTSFNITPPTQQTPDASTKDISQQLLNLLNRCSDVVDNMTVVLGYMPYHAL
ncbi:hypothetical protein OROGR_020477 [Orobanche gracilis]